ncbi:hypothetical protein TREMEDRAFT_63765 [Tremella mesenterica DSM 1558]|uniref:uncharacterized protein n=1 Tax=Tremella mesenterica (strain ATCC 24925 / CBS 8224 / DSM 1558 / NBRC 9311 / NRRL Y-6157 / RJB 2259-6 / UBC 559-6) TaxID=578456 RepID=UPI0003F48F71|nr:uncharacterized protein TREMEDRAFT_63765 [Tremella mesenterica DSM 1558]EIW67872.1 hypothetical protein TREMEDRAFT_63765 [Tremella mesenterica DSM 1558]
MEGGRSSLNARGDDVASMILKVQDPNLVSIFINVKNRVSNWSLFLMNKQYDKATSGKIDNDDESNMYSTSVGLPSARHIKEVLENDGTIALSPLHRHWRLLNPYTWPDTIKQATAKVSGDISGVHPLLGPEWDVDNDTNRIRDPHLRRNKLALSRKNNQNPPVPSITQIDLTKDNDDDDDLLPVENPFFSPPSPTLPPSPKRGVKSNPSQMSNDVSHTGRLHTQSEKFIGIKKKANRPCPLCGSRSHGPKKCKRANEHRERDPEAYDREVKAYDAGETTWTEGSVLGTNAALEKRLAELQETVAGLTKSIQEDRDKREKENRPVVVRTEDRMVRRQDVMAGTGYLETPGNGQYPPNRRVSRARGVIETPISGEFMSVAWSALLKFRWWCPDETRVVPGVDVGYQVVLLFLTDAFCHDD